MCATTPSETKSRPSGRERLECSLSVRDMPEVLLQLKQQVANIIRDVANTETPLVKTRLKQIADVFEEN